MDVRLVAEVAPVKRVRRRMVRSAGSVVLRQDADGIRALVVHRRQRDDWTLPKGRLRGRELSAAAARREVDEEAALDCAAGVRVLEVAWVDARGRRRSIAYWLLELVAERPFAPTDEIAEIAWLTPVEAVERLCQPRDRRALVRAIAVHAVASSRPAAV